MRSLGIAALCCGLLLLAGAGTANAEFDLLHEFAGWPGDGAQPKGSLVYDAGAEKLYSMTSIGGANDYGTVFEMDTDGSGYSVLHNFVGGVDDGWAPYGSLTLDPSTGLLYGMANAGGDSDDGVVFSMDPANPGGTFTLIHEFAGGIDDGEWPEGSLTLDASVGKLYGMTYGGGDAGDGVVFSMDLDGNNHTLLHEFVGGADDGDSPKDSLILSGGKLYGMTSYGGDDDDGVVFSMNAADGGDFTLLHEFSGGPADGEYTEGSLVMSGGKLYGMTMYGGTDDNGAVFRMNPDGSGFNLLHSFDSAVDDGYNPYGSLIVNSGRLYGMTQNGGSTWSGVIFSMGLNGSGYVIHHEFDATTPESGRPYGDLLAIGQGEFVGMTHENWSGHNYGTVFAFDVIPEPGSFAVLALGLAGMIGRRRRK